MEISSCIYYGDGATIVNADRRFVKHASPFGSSCLQVQKKASTLNQAIYIYTRTDVS